MNIFSYPHHINDWRGRTAHLTHEQRGVYREMMDQYYLTGGNMPADHEIVCRMVSAITESERNAVAYAIAEFFTVRNDKLRHKRCDEEIEKITAKKTKAKASADTKWKKIKDKMPCERITERIEKADANAMLANSQEPLSNILASPVTTSARQADKKIFEENEIRFSRRDEPAWLPELAESEILPGGWSDFAEALDLQSEQIYRSWGKFKATSTRPFQFCKWQGWIKREHGAKTKLEAVA